MSSCNFCQKYNGYTNKPTWLYQLWAANDPGIYTWLLSQARDALENQGYEVGTELEAESEQNAVTELADTLQADFDATHENDTASLETDLWSTVSAFIDWHEIAEYTIESAIEEKED